MSNPLTGDFEAVLQVSGDTINRLLASMHQNGFAQPHLPSFPHAVSMRIGDGHAIDGVRGYLQAQVSVPRVELIHGVTDRFLLEVGIRAWYRPDPGTTRLPSFIHGTVRAEYRIQDIDPGCGGWAKLAPDYLWIRVVKDSVRFQGTTAEDTGGLAGLVSLTAADETASIEKITHQIAGLLATQFEATPHPVTKRFKRGSMRSLNASNGRSAVVIPIGLSGDPAGDIASVNTLLLDRADVAVGVSIAYVRSIVDTRLAPFANFTKTVKVHVELPLKDIDTVYRVSVAAPVVTWLPKGSFAVFNVKVHGSATTRSVLPNTTFDVDQDVMLHFDSGSGRMWLAPGSLNVTVHASGLGCDEVTDAVAPAVSAAAQAVVVTACAQAQPELDAMSERTQVLIDQLKTIDDNASAQLNRAEFVHDGIVLRGRISLGSRRAPVVQAELSVDQNGHTAFQSWIPGGRIDSFEWLWSWFGIGAAPPGRATHDDRFVLRRPRSRGSRWGAVAGLTSPLPGIDGWGSVCLRITGVQVDAVTGKPVHVISVKRCNRFGFNISDRIRADGRLLWRDVPELSQDVPFPELALVRAGGAHVASRAANTLLIYADETWSSDTAMAVRRGLEACGRFDAGLALLVLFRDGRLAAPGQRLQAQVEEFARDIGIAAFVNEDVRGGWSQALDIRSGAGAPAWRLMAPDGVVTWAHDGQVSPDTLAAALDVHLQRSPDHAPSAFRSGLEIGRQVSATALHPGWFEGVEVNCPPLPLGRLGTKESVVAFVQHGSASSMAQLRHLFSLYGQADAEGPVLVVVVDGADGRETEALKNEWGVDVIAMPDPSGAITDRFGVVIWPTTMTIDRVGRISAIETGVSLRREDADEHSASETGLTSA